MTWEFKLEPTTKQVSEIEYPLDGCRNVWNFALRDCKDWLDSRKSPVQACSMRQALILPSDAPFPNYPLQTKGLTTAKLNFPRPKTVNAQVLQQVLRKLDGAWELWRLRRAGFPRFTKPNRMRSFVFPQMLKNGVSDHADPGIRLPQRGLVKVRWLREIPNLFPGKQARMVRKASGYFVMLSLQTDGDIPAAVPHGHPIGMDVGLEDFLSTSDGEQVKRPRFFDSLHRPLKNQPKGSANWLKLQTKIARVRQSIADTHKGWHFKLAHHPCAKAGMVFGEDLDLRRMSQGMRGKHVLDTGLGQWIHPILPGVCWQRHVYDGQGDAAGTSEACPDCDAAVRQDLSNRGHHGHNGGSIKPRDGATGQGICSRGQRQIETAWVGEAAGAGVTQPSGHLSRRTGLGQPKESPHNPSGYAGRGGQVIDLWVVGI